MIFFQRDQQFDRCPMNLLIFWVAFAQITFVVNSKFVTGATVLS